jgi:hypothetical protein
MIYQIFYETQRTMMVAVAARLPSSGVAPSFPPQQSPILGHLASSHTVCSFSPLRSFLIWLKDPPDGIFVFRKDGSRGLKTRYEYMLLYETFVSLKNERIGISQNHAVGRAAFNVSRDELIQRRSLCECLTKACFGPRWRR